MFQGVALTIYKIISAVIHYKQRSIVQKVSIALLLLRKNI